MLSSLTTGLTSSVFEDEFTRIKKSCLSSVANTLRTIQRPNTFSRPSVRAFDLEDVAFVIAFYTCQYVGMMAITLFSIESLTANCSASYKTAKSLSNTCNLFWTYL